MPSLTDLFLSTLVPALVCGTLLALIWASRASGVEQSLARRHLQALAVAAGFFAGYLAIVGAPVLPSENRRLAALDWLPWLAIAALLVSLVQATGAGRRVPAWIYIGVVCVLVPTLSFLGRFASGAPWRDLVISAVLLFAAWRSTESLARRVLGPAVPIALLVVATGTSIATLLSHSAKIAQLDGALASSLGACMVVAIWNRRLCSAGGTVAIAMTVLGASWINAVHFADLPPLSAVLLIAALFTPWLAALGRAVGTPSVKRGLALALLAAIPAVAAVLVAQQSAPSYDF